MCCIIGVSCMLRIGDVVVCYRTLFICWILQRYDDAFQLNLNSLASWSYAFALVVLFCFVVDESYLARVERFFRQIPQIRIRNVRICAYYVNICGCSWKSKLFRVTVYMFDYVSVRFQAIVYGQVNVINACEPFENIAGFLTCSTLITKMFGQV